MGGELPLLAPQIILHWDWGDHYTSWCSPPLFYSYLLLFVRECWPKLSRSIKEYILFRLTRSARKPTLVPIFFVFPQAHYSYHLYLIKKEYFNPSIHVYYLPEIQILIYLNVYIWYLPFDKFCCQSMIPTLTSTRINIDK